jgi:hypothetical protein
VAVPEGADAVIVHHFITLTQPWASLMAPGWKTIETRSWSTRYRGPIAIHAAKAFPKDCRGRIADEYFGPMLYTGGYHRAEQLPVGKILAVCYLEDCQPAEDIYPRISEMERAFGDYSPGRFGFITSDLRRLKTPVPFKGALGIRQIHGEPITEDMLA